MRLSCWLCCVSSLCAEVQLNFSEFTAERWCVGGTLDSIDIPHKLAYLTHIWYVMCIWPPTSLFRSPTRSGLRQETSLLHTQFFGFFLFVGKHYKKPLNFSRVFVENFRVQWKFLVRLRWLIAKCRYLMLVQHSKPLFFGIVSRTANNCRAIEDVSNRKSNWDDDGLPRHIAASSHLLSRANIV